MIKKKKKKVKENNNNKKDHKISTPKTTQQTSGKTLNAQ